MQINKLRPGDAYSLVKKGTQSVSLQVGAGGDCGVFIGPCAPATFKSRPAFRVIVNEKCIRRDWKKCGAFELSDYLRIYKEYSEKPIGSDVGYKVILSDIDNRIAIDEDEYSSIEPLAVWETRHIMDRINHVLESDPQRGV